MSRRILTAGALAGVVLVGGGGVAYAQMQGDAGSYRTAFVTTGDVDRVMNLSGTVKSSSRRDLSFGTSGTSTRVAVAAGDRVHSGEVLARLDATDLKNAVTKASATLAGARAKLESDESSQSSTVATAAKSSSSSSTSSPSKSSNPTKGAKPDPALQKALADVKQQQVAVTTAQTDATTAIAAAKAALAAQKTACADDDASGDSDDPTPEAGLSPACAAALDAVQTAQDAVAAKQDILQTALETLSKTLDVAITAVQKAAATPTGSSGGGSGSGSGSSGSSSASGSTATPSSTGGTRDSGSTSASGLAADQASIDTAKAQLTEAKLAADSATLTAPYSGRILSVSVAKGDSVGSSDVVMVLVGDGGSTATTTVTADQIGSIKKGQTAEVTPAGASEPVSGTVTSIGLLPDTSSSTTTYPVTIDLADGVTAPEGTTASIAVVTGTAKDALTVPSSTLTKLGSRAIVRVLEDGKETPTIVTVGVVGSTRTSITQGLKKGQTVVIADLDASLPSGGTTTNRFGGGTFTRFGGGGGAPVIRNR